jgi:hypothetical protein
MKKVMWIALAIYGVVAGVLLWTAKADEKEIHILSVRESRSRLITSPDETVDIPLYFSREDTFFIEPRWVRTARLTDGEEEMAVSLDIIDTQETTPYQKRSYFLYRFRIGFRGIDADGMRLDWDSARLIVDYENEKTLSVEIGDLSLVFFHGDNPPHLDFFRLYPVMGEGDQASSLQGFVLGLKSQTASPILITGISTGMREARVDFSAIREWTESDHPRSGNEAVGDPDFEWVRSMPPSETGNRILPDSVCWFVPLVHLERSHRLNRFPILLSYRYQGQEYSFFIDDFLFFTPSPLLEVPDGDICESIYRD